MVDQQARSGGGEDVRGPGIRGLKGGPDDHAGGKVGGEAVTGHGVVAKVGVAFQIFGAEAVVPDHLLDDLAGGDASLLGAATAAETKMPMSKQRARALARGFRCRECVPRERG